MMYVYMPLFGLLEMEHISSSMVAHCANHLQSEKNLHGLKSWAWPPRVLQSVWIPVSLGFCVRVLQQFFYYAKPFRRTPKGWAEFSEEGEPGPVFRDRKRHINIWHINDFSVAPVTDPRGTRTKMFMFLGFRTQHINF